LQYSFSVINFLKMNEIPLNAIVADGD